MRTIGLTSAILIGCGVALASCSDDNSLKPSNEGGARQGAGGHAGGSTGGAVNGGGNNPNGFAGESIGGLANGGGDWGTVAGRSNDSSENTGGTIGNAAAGTSGDPQNAAAGASDGGHQNTAAAGASAGFVACTPMNDTCPNGQYCGSAAVCVTGCKTGANCTSGICLSDHSCQACISDIECSDGKLCGSGKCSAPCTATSNGTAGGPASSTCSGGLSCCGSRCVDTTVDTMNCLGCGVACQAGKFCGAAGCAPARIESLCKVPRVTGLLVERVDDLVDDAQTAVLVNAFSGCSPVPSSSFSGQSTGSVVNPTTGQPVARGTLLAVAGGPFFQRLVNYLTDQALLPVYDVWDWTNNTVTVLSRRDNSELRKLSFSEMSSTRDLIIVEVAVDPITGTPSLVAYGADKGTPAAAWYFAHVAMTDMAAGAKTWFVCDWTDQGAVGPDTTDTWNCTSG